MNTETYRFRIGSFDCIAVSDGTMTYASPMFPPPANFLFLNSEEKSLYSALKEQGIDLAQWNAWVSPYTCLFIDTGRDTLLIDTGAGSLAESTGKLLQNLKAEQISPGDVGYVLLSHGHPDHVGGNLGASGRPVFPDARWIIMKNEWDFWTTERAERQLDEHSREMLVNIARTNLLPLENKIEVVENGTEIVPGIYAIDASGHTPGLMAISIISGDDSLFYISDTVIHPVHLAHPEWHSAVDVLPDHLFETRQNLLGKAEREKSLIMAFHFPFPGLGYVNKEKQGWNWQPFEGRS